MDSARLLELVSQLKRAPLASGRRAPHKPLLLLLLLGRLQQAGTSAVVYEEIEEALDNLIADFGPPATRSRGRAAMPFFHLERELWQLDGDEGQTLSDQRGRLRKAHAHGRLAPEVEAALRADPALLAAAARLLLEEHFTDSYVSPICAAVGLDLDALDAAAAGPGVPSPVRRDPFFREAVLLAYGYACAMCGFDGRLRRDPVGIEAAHVRWFSHGGPDDAANGVALCALHHALFDFGALGLTAEREIRVSRDFVGVSASSSRLVHDLDGQRLTEPQRGHQQVAAEYIAWHGAQVFRGAGAV